MQEKPKYKSGATSWRVLVTDGQERAALAVTRALGECNLVVVGSDRGACLAGASKYCWRSIQYPSPYRDPGAYVSRIINAVKEYEIDIVLPVSDVSAGVINDHRDAVGRCARVALPSRDALESLTDKCRLMGLARALAIPIPRTVYVQDGNVDDVCAAIDRFPVIVKPSRSIYREGDRYGKTAVHLIHTRSELRAAYDRETYLRYASMVQSRIDGQGYGVSVLADHGKIISVFAHRRIREKPPAGGVSVLSESISLRQPMTEYALALLRHVGWHGVAMVEFKEEHQTGTPFLIEVNGRFWGSLQLAIEAGVNFPVQLLQLLTNQPVETSGNTYRTGVKLRWFLGDLDHLFLRSFKQTRNEDMPSHLPGMTRAVLAFLRFFQRDMRYEVLRKGDPRPGLHELKVYFRDMLMKAKPPAVLGANPGKSPRNQTNGTPLITKALRSCLSSVNYWKDSSTRKLKVLGEVRRVTFVCKGNICRSPMAAAYFEGLVKQHEKSMVIESAGLDTRGGCRAHPLAEKVCFEKGIDLTPHRTRILTADMIEGSDFIIVMEYEQIGRVLQKYPQAIGKIVGLGAFARGIPRDIRDPYSGALEQFQDCYSLITVCCNNLWEHLMTTERVRM